MHPGGPAASAGVAAGDVILSFDGNEIRDSSELPWLASTAGVGHVARLVVARGAERRNVQLRLTEMPQQR